MMGLNDIDQDFFLFLPESTRIAILDAEDIASTLEKLGYNVPHLISVFRDISFLRVSLKSPQ